MSDTQKTAFEGLDEDQQVAALRLNAALKELGDGETFKDIVAAGAPQVASAAKKVRSTTNQKPRRWQNHKAQLAAMFLATTIFNQWLSWEPGESEKTEDEITIEDQKKQLEEGGKLNTAHLKAVGKAVKDLKAKDAEMAKAVTKARAEGEASTSPYDAERDSMLYNGSTVSMPALALLKLSPEEAEAALKRAGGYALVEPKAKEVGWDINKANIDGRMLIFPEERTLQSDEGRAAIVKALEAVRADPLYTDKNMPRIGYHFNVVKDPATGEITGLDILQNPGADNIGPNTSLGTFDISEPK